MDARHTRLSTEAQGDMVVGWGGVVGRLGASGGRLGTVRWAGHSGGQYKSKAKGSLR